MSASGWRTREALEIVTPMFHCPDWDDPYGHVRPLVDRAISGDWHATGLKKIGDGKQPGRREVISPDSWEYLVLDANYDTASGGGVEYVGLRWFNDAPPLADESDAESPPAVSQKDAIGIVIIRVRGELKNELQRVPRLSEIWSRLEAYGDPIKKSTDHKLVWRDGNGHHQELTREALKKRLGRLRAKELKKRLARRRAKE